MIKKIKKSLAFLIAITMCMCFTVTAFAAEIPSTNIRRPTSITSVDAITVGSIVFSPQTSSGILPDSATKSTKLNGGNATHFGYIAQPVNNNIGATFSVNINNHVYKLTVGIGYQEVNLAETIYDGSTASVHYYDAYQKLSSLSIVFF